MDKVIIGIDNSLSSPGIVKAYLDKDTLDFKQLYFLGFSKSKTFEKSTTQGQILYYNDIETKKKSKDFEFGIDKYLWMRSKIFEFIGGYADYAAFEDYAFGAKGQVFQIAESTGALKVGMWESCIPYKLYNIATIKQFATGKGDADKIHMEEAYNCIKYSDKLDLSFLPMVKDAKANNPKDNIIDAYFITALLQTELKIRAGLITLDQLTGKIRECFYKVTKANPINIPVQPFIQQKRVNNEEN